MWLHIVYTLCLCIQLHPQVVQRLTGGPLHPPSHPHLSSAHKVPIITNYAPQLPMGPGPILQFPFSYPAPPVVASTAAPPNVPTAVSSHDNSLPRHLDSVETAPIRDVKRMSSREEGFAFHSVMRHQQQQQQQALQKMEMAQAHAHAHQPPTTHPVQGKKIYSQI